MGQNTQGTLDYSNLRESDFCEMPYKLYTQDNIKKRYVDINQALEYVEDNEKEEFLKNIHEWKLYRDDNTFDIIEYSAIYCEFDCKINQPK
jgi:hypothetical protein